MTIFLPKITILMPKMSIKGKLRFGQKLFLSTSWKRFRQEKVVLYFQEDGQRRKMGIKIEFTQPAKLYLFLRVFKKY